MKLKYLNVKMGSRHTHYFIIFLTARPGIFLEYYFHEFHY